MSLVKLPRPGRLPMHWWPHITALALIVMECCWLVPWYRTVIEVSYVASPLRAWVVLAGIMLVAYCVSAGLEVLLLLPVVQRGVQLFILVVCLIFGARILLNSEVVSVVNGLVELDPGAVLVLFAVLWLWWRGSTLGREPIRPILVWYRFLLGLFLLLAHVFTITRMRGLVDGSAAGLGIFALFLLVSLLAMVFSRVAYIGLVHGARRNPFDRRWFETTTAIVVGVVLLAVTLGSLITGQYTSLLAWLAETLKTAAAVVLFIIGLPFLLLGYLLGPLLPLIKRGISTPTPSAAILTPEPGSVTYVPPLLEPVEVVPISPQFQMFIFWSIILLVIILLVFGRRQLGGKNRRSGDEMESLLKPKDALRLLRKTLREGVLGAAQRLGARLRPGDRLLAAARVRRIYAQLMDLCAALGHPRPEAKTPLEFLPTLGETFPGLIHELAQITEAYDQVRYGELPETQAVVDELEAAWKRIASEGQKLRLAALAKPVKMADVDEARRVKL